MKYSANAYDECLNARTFADGDTGEIYMMNLRFVSCADINVVSRSHTSRNRHTMRCELESCGFWLYFDFKIELCATPSAPYPLCDQARDADVPDGSQELLVALVRVRRWTLISMQNTRSGTNVLSEEMNACKGRQRGR